ncbi:MAG: hypothetical protein ACXWV0_04995 [Flavisolibacter sp.]
MDKNLPNKDLERQMENISIPNQEHAWQKLKNLLEDDDRKKRPLIPVFLRSCLLWGGLSVIVLAAAWLVFKPSEWGQQSTGNKSFPQKHLTPVNNGDAATPQQEKTVKEIIPGSVMHQMEEKTQDENVNKDAIPVPGTSISSTPDQINRNSIENIRDNTKTVIKKERPVRQKKKSSTGAVNENKFALIQQPVPEYSKEQKQNIPGRVPSKSDNVSSNVISKTDSSFEKAVDSNIIKTTVPFSISRDSMDKKEPVMDTVQASAELKVKKQKRFLFSAGLGVQQQVPFMGQTAVPYNYYGRKNSLSDYIPSVYVKAEKNGKWFLMGEFRFGAPQSLKELSYSRQTKFDTSSNLLTTTTMKLKKTYYHQLPFSFNYYVKPGWTVGLGGIYSRFYGAVTEKEVNNLNIQTQAETVSKQITMVQQFTDSFLYKTQLHMMVQTDVQWKRFTVGLRYAKDLQPYIKYTQPDGKINEEKNAFFQLILRYRLWDSE